MNIKYIVATVITNNILHYSITYYRYITMCREINICCSYPIYICIYNTRVCTLSEVSNTGYARPTSLDRSLAGVYGTDYWPPGHWERLHARNDGSAEGREIY